MIEITEEEFWPDILRQQYSVIITHFISSKFSDLSNVSASENSLFTGCPIFDRFCLYFALLSLLVFCVVLLIKEKYTTIVILANVYNQLMICICCTFEDFIYGDTNPSNQVLWWVLCEENCQVEELRVMNKDQEGQTLKLGDVTPKLTLHTRIKAWGCQATSLQPSW